MSCGYWIWKSDICNEQQMVLHRPSKFIHERDLVFDEGVLIPRSSVPEPLELIPRPGDAGFLTDNLAAPGIRGLVVSSRVRSLMECAGVDNIQYFHIDSPLGRDPAPSNDYFIANIIGVIDCVDAEKSQIVMVDDVIRSIDGLSLRADATHDFDIFRLKDPSSIVVVSERLKNAVIHSELTGVVFLEPGEFTY